MLPKVVCLPNAVEAAVHTLVLAQKMDVKHDDETK